MMKSGTVMLACLLASSSFFAAGCSQAPASADAGQPESQEEAASKVSTEDFLDAVKRGVQKRWEFADSAEDQTSPETYETAVSDALDSVKSFKGQPFEDADLQKVAEKYIQALEDSLSAAQMMKNDRANGMLKYTAANSEYEDDLVDLYENFGLRFDDKYSEDFKMYQESASLDSSEDGTQEILQLDYSLQIEKSADDTGFPVYTLTGKNNSDKTFNSFMYELDLENDQGEAVGTASTDTIGNLDPGQSFRSEIFYSGDDDLMSLDVTPKFQPLDASVFSD